MSDLHWEKILKHCAKGKRLSSDEALILFEQAPLMDLGLAAHRRNVERNQHRVFYNINRHINPTNVCVMSCKFCAYSKKPGEEGAYVYSLEEIGDRAETALSEGATEVHMVGGLHPRWRLKDYANIVNAVKSRCPDLHIKAFTAVELDWMARKERMEIADVLTVLRDAGLGSLPGGGAEIFHPDIRDQICDTKTDAQRWIEIHRIAHGLEMRSNCTMLYGHIESPWHRIDHMNRLRELQDETHGFNVFIPLSFQPDDNDMGMQRYTRAEDDLRTIAVARLFLDNFQHIKAYWIMLGQAVAQVATQFGANDVDGTVTEEKISRAAGGQAGMKLNRDYICDLIERAGSVPVERDTLYRLVSRDNSHSKEDPSNMPSAQQVRAKDFSERLQFLSTPTGDDLQDLARQSEQIPLADLGRLASNRCRPTGGDRFSRKEADGEDIATICLTLRVDSRGRLSAASLLSEAHHLAHLKKSFRVSLVAADTLSLAEYLRGLALARIILPETVELRTEFSAVSKALGWPKDLEVSARWRHPTWKLAGLFTAFGASGFGSLDWNEEDLSEFRERLELA